MEFAPSLLLAHNGFRGDVVSLQLSVAHPLIYSDKVGEQTLASTQRMLLFLSLMYQPRLARNVGSPWYGRIKLHIQFHVKLLLTNGP